MASVTLGHRAVLGIGGAEAEPFLQRLVTANLDALDAGSRGRSLAPCALLSPQGKVLHEFTIARDGEGFRIDVSRAFLPDLARRLMTYRLHAAVTFAPEPSATVRAHWDEEAPFRDMRFRGEIGRSYGPGEDTGTLSEWTRRRIGAGVAEIGTDYPGDEYFPHDLGLAQNGGVATAKGCYVGQEVVSRMHHRGTGRRRVAILEADAPFPAPGTPVQSNGRPIGTLGSATADAPFLALAVLRIDRAADAVAAGGSITVGEVAVAPRVPPGAGWSLDPVPSPETVATA